MRRIALVTAGMTLGVVAAQAQVPDLLNAFDAGGRSMGAGGAFYGNDASTLSAYYNPASLGFLDRRQFDLSYRSFSSTTSTTTHRYVAEDSSNSGNSRRVSHIGYAVPLRELTGKGNGTVSFSYTVGGYINDQTVGVNLVDPSITGFAMNRESQTDFYTIALGRTNASQSLAYGVGLIGVNEKLSVDMISTFSGGSDSVRNSGNAYGFGAIAGLQYIPPKKPNLSLGASFRTPIKLSGNDEVTQYIDRLPGRVLLSATYRRDGLREGSDFMVFGAQVQNFFGGSSNALFDRTQQTIFGIGTEYNYVLANFRIPVRIGFTTVSSGGDGFTQRNAFTYGLGYRPNNGPYSIDFNWAAPAGGGSDFSATASYRF